MIPRHLYFGVAVLLVLVVSMGIYVGQMRRKASEMASPAADYSFRRSTGFRTNRNGDAVCGR